MNLKESNFNEIRMLSAAEACRYMGLGRSMGVKLCKEIGAEVKVGKRCLYDKRTIDNYIDDMKPITENEDNEDG